MSIIVKMALRRFALTPFGVFSTLQCGDTRLYVHEPFWDVQDETFDSLTKEIYEVIRVKSDKDHDNWFIVTHDHAAPREFALMTDDMQNLNNLQLGKALGMIADEWCVVECGDAIDEFESILDGVDKFFLYPIDDTGLDKNHIEIGVI